MRTVTAKQPPALSAHGIAGLPRRLFDTPLLWERRTSERRQLMGMNETMLKDLGVSRVDVEHEVAKPFWRA